MSTPSRSLRCDRLAKDQPAEITMFQISEVQESPAFNGRRSFLTLRVRLLGVTVGGVMGRSTVLCSFQLHLDRRWVELRAELRAVLEVDELTLRCLGVGER